MFAPSPRLAASILASCYLTGQRPGRPGSRPRTRGRLVGLRGPDGHTAHCVSCVHSEPQCRGGRHRSASRRRSDSLRIGAKRARLRSWSVAALSGPSVRSPFAIGIAYYLCYVRDTLGSFGPTSERTSDSYCTLRTRSSNTLSLSVCTWRLHYCVGILYAVSCMHFCPRDIGCNPVNQTQICP